MADKIINIKTLAGEFANKADLQQYCNSLFLSHKKQIEDISQLKTEILHLQSLLASTVPLLPGSKEVEFIVSTEQQIVESQIEMIKKRGMAKEFDLEDAKKLEILVKTLNHIKTSKTPPKKQSIPNLPVGALEQLASIKKEESSDDA